MCRVSLCFRLFRSDIRNCLAATIRKTSTNLTIINKLYSEFEQSTPPQTIVSVQELNLDHFATYSPVKQENITKIKQSRYRRTEEILNKTNLKFSNVERKKISTLLPGELEQRYYNLLDLGFKNVTATDVIRYNQIIKMKRFCLELQYDPLDSLISQTDAPAEYLKETIVKNFPILLEADLKLLHLIVLLEYLRWKLELEIKSFLALIKKYPSVCNKSISFLSDLIDLLTIELGFTTKKIVSHGYLLLSNKDNVDRILKEKPIMAGIPIKKFIQQYPRTSYIHIDRINETDECLSEFDVSPEQIRACGLIYSFKPSTVRSRLEILSKMEEINDLKTHRRFLFLVYYFNKVQHRLDVLNFIKFEKISVDILISSNKNFAKRLDLEGCRKRKYDIAIYIADKFDLTLKSVYHRIDFEYFSGMTLDENKMTASIDYLCHRFPREEILGNLSVILFDVDMIEKELKVVRNLSRTKVNMLSELRVNLENSLKELYLRPYKPDFKMKYGRKVDNDSEDQLMNSFLAFNNNNNCENVNE